MKTIKMVNIVLAIFLAGILLSAGSAAPLDLDQTRPNVIYREVTQYYENQLVMGNNSDSSLEIILNSVTYGSDRLTVRGDPNITRTNDSITVEGDVSATRTLRILNLISGYQKDSYLQNQPVGERFSVSLTDAGNTNSIATNINTTLPINVDFVGLQENENFTEVQRSDLDLTGFVFRAGFLGSITLNDSDGNALTTVVGFQTYLTILLFQTSTQEIIGAYQSTIGGYGNIFPTKIVSYLSNQSYVRDVGDSTNGIAQLEGQDRISWYYVGYNDTLDLDIYSASFQMLRQSQGILFSPDTVSTGLMLSSVSLGAETFFNDLESEYDLEVEDTDAEDFDDKIVADTIEQEDETPDDEEPSPEVPDDTSAAMLDFNVTALMIGQIVALVIMGNVIFRKMRN